MRSARSTETHKKQLLNDQKLVRPGSPLTRPPPNKDQTKPATRSLLQKPAQWDVTQKDTAVPTDDLKAVAAPALENLNTIWTTQVPTEDPEAGSYSPICTTRKLIQVCAFSHLPSFHPFLSLHSLPSAEPIALFSDPSFPHNIQSSIPSPSPSSTPSHASL